MNNWAICDLALNQITWWKKKPTHLEEVRDGYGTLKLSSACCFRWRKCTASSHPEPLGMPWGLRNVEYREFGNPTWRNCWLSNSEIRGEDVNPLLTLAWKSNSQPCLLLSGAFCPWTKAREGVPLLISNLTGYSLHHFACLPLRSHGW